MGKYYTSPYERPFIPPEYRRSNCRPLYSRQYGEDNVLRKHTSYPESFCLTPRQREACIGRVFSGAEILSTNGRLLMEFGAVTLRIAALNARPYIIDGAKFYVVKF